MTKSKKLRNLFLILLLVVVFLFSGYSLLKRVIENEIQKINKNNFKIIKIYHIIGGSGTSSVEIPVNNNYECEHWESQDYVYYNNQDDNIASTKEFVFNIQSFENHKLITLSGNHVLASRDLFKVSDWGTTVVCIHKDYGESHWWSNNGNIDKF